MEKVRREKMQVREKVERLTKHSVFPMFCGSGGSNSRLAKAAGAKPAGLMKDEKSHAVVAGSTCGSQNLLTPQLRNAFGCRKSARSWGTKHICKSKCTKHTRIGPVLEVDVEDVHLVVALSTFPSQKCETLTGWSFVGS